MRVRDIMTTPVIAVTPSASPSEASGLMTRNGVTVVPVVDGLGQLLGLLSEDDLVRAGLSGEPDARVDAALDRHHTVSSIMRSPGIAAAIDLDVTDLAHRMAEAGLRSIPVLEGGVLVGMVSFDDVLRALSATRAS